MTPDFITVAACVPKVRVACPPYNVERIAAMAAGVQADVMVFPEMGITSYTAGDLFHNTMLLEGAVEGLERLGDLLEADSRTRRAVVAVGMALVCGGTLYNVAVMMRGKRLLAVIPKTYIPNYNEFYEDRWWSPAPEGVRDITLLGQTVPMGTDILIDVAGIKVAAEICEDLWTPVPPSCRHAMAGADVVVNLSASDTVIAKRDYLTALVRQQSARCLCGYVYASAGFGESSTDLVFDGIGLVCDRGRLAAANSRWQGDGSVTVACIDVAALRHDRITMSSWHASARHAALPPYTIVDSGLRTLIKPLPDINPRPFVPSDKGHRDERCAEIVNIQTAGLAQRLDATGTHSLVVGISGGLDSTLALLVAVRTFDRLGLDRKGIHAVTMPGFGTTGRTHGNAWELMELLGVSVRDIPIGPAVEQHFKDIGHDAAVHDVTYENSQARQRTLLLMDIANQVGGMVLGTGDLSELALGWATYNGDHMSMYGVNAGVPKTLVRHLVQWFADKDLSLRRVLLDIIDTPVSPELIPADAADNITQKTEDLVGPYELHDFFLYHMLRYGLSPRQIWERALAAFDGTYEGAVILKWLKVFVRRFFAQQFKRSCMPDGPKVGSVSLSPRGDWRMPSDASARLWLEQLDTLKP